MFYGEYYASSIGGLRLVTLANFDGVQLTSLSFAAVVLVVPLFKRINVSPVLGFLLAGQYFLLARDFYLM